MQSASGEHTCLPGGVNALSRKFNENFSMESDSAEETIQSIEQADIDGKHSEGLTDCDRTSEEPTCIQYSDDIEDDPFNLPPPLSPLDVQLLEDSVQKDALGRLKVLFVTDVISFLL